MLFLLFWWRQREGHWAASRTSGRVGRDWPSPQAHQGTPATLSACCLPDTAPGPRGGRNGNFGHMETLDSVSVPWDAEEPIQAATWGRGWQLQPASVGKRKGPEVQSQGPQATGLLQTLLQGDRQHSLHVLSAGADPQMARHGATTGGGACAPGGAEAQVGVASKQQPERGREAQVTTHLPPAPQV